MIYAMGRAPGAHLLGMVQTAQAAGGPHGVGAAAALGPSVAGHPAGMGARRSPPLGPAAERGGACSRSPAPSDLAVL